MLETRLRLFLIPKLKRPFYQPSFFILPERHRVLRDTSRDNTIFVRYDRFFSCETWNVCTLDSSRLQRSALEGGHHEHGSAGAVSRLSQFDVVVYKHSKKTRKWAYSKLPLLGCTRTTRNGAECESILKFKVWIFGWQTAYFRQKLCTWAQNTPNTLVPIWLKKYNSFLFLATKRTISSSNKFINL